MKIRSGFVSNSSSSSFVTIVKKEEFDKVVDQLSEAAREFLDSDTGTVGLTEVFGVECYIMSELCANDYSYVSECLSGEQRECHYEIEELFSKVAKEHGWSHHMDG